MYLIRRIYVCKERTGRQVAELISKIGNLYVDAGQRSPIRVYLSGSTVPGPADTVYMDWTAETLESPYREGNVSPAGIAELGAQLREFVEEADIEFYEMYSPI